MTRLLVPACRHTVRGPSDAHTPRGSISDFSYTFFDRDPRGGQPLLAFRRVGRWNRRHLADIIVAEPDGPVRCMTAPYTTDPARLQQSARPLRPELKSDANIGHHSQAWYVGCGYAARATLRRVVSVVRLSDGAMWFIPRSTEPWFGWTKVLGLTCDPIYVLGGVQGFPEGSVIVRFRLSTLGEPLASDVVDVDDSGTPIP